MDGTYYTYWFVGDGCVGGRTRESWFYSRLSRQEQNIPIVLKFFGFLSSLLPSSPPFLPTSIFLFLLLIFYFWSILSRLEEGV